MKRYAPLLVVIATAGCGAANHETTPPNPPSLRGGPPPAWVETRFGSHWLAYSSYCWRNRCADYAAPECPGHGLPVIELRQGGLVRFHLGFGPDRVEVSGEGQSLPLKPSRDPIWKAQG
jgi:hypothetical protein